MDLPCVKWADKRLGTQVGPQVIVLGMFWCIAFRCLEAVMSKCECT